MSYVPPAVKAGRRKRAEADREAVKHEDEDGDEGEAPVVAHGRRKGSARSLVRRGSASGGPRDDDGSSDDRQPQRARRGDGAAEAGEGAGGGAGAGGGRGTTRRGRGRRGASAGGRGGASRRGKGASVGVGSGSHRSSGRTSGDASRRRGGAAKPRVPKQTGIKAPEGADGSGTAFDTMNNIAAHLVRRVPCSACTPPWLV